MKRTYTIKTKLEAVKLVKKASRIVILFGLIMSISFAISSSPISASSQNSVFYKQGEDFQIQAVGREVTHSIIGNLNQNFDSYYYYSDPHGYSGRIPLLYVIRDEPRNMATAVYRGIVYCEGVCQNSKEINDEN